MSDDRTARRFFFVLFLIATTLLAAVIYPIASALFMAAVFAGVLWPLQKRLAARLRGARSLSAGLLVAAAVLIVAGPLAALSTIAVKEATGGVQFVSETVRSEGMSGLVRRLPPSLQRVAGAVVSRFEGTAGTSDAEVVTAQGGRAAAFFAGLATATGSLVFQLTMMLIALFFLLVEGDNLVDWIDSVSPLRAGQSRELLSEFKKVSYAVIVSTVITSAVQALAALVGYLIARVPNPVFFAGATFFVAFIPAVGAASVCLAAAALLFLTGHPYMALFLAIWGVTVVALVDNIVKPMLVKAGMEMRGAVVFFALIGGLGAFGPVGLILGPLVVSLFLALVRIYDRDFRRSQNR